MVAVGAPVRLWWAEWSSGEASRCVLLLVDSVFAEHSRTGEIFVSFGSFLSLSSYLSSFSLSNIQTSWIDTDKLADFIMKCQDQEDGGISDRPGNMGDIFHTYFGICGLLLLRYFDGREDEAVRAFDNIDPTYALPVKVVQKLQLRAQVLPDVKIV